MSIKDMLIGVGAGISSGSGGGGGGATYGLASVEVSPEIITVTTNAEEVN